MKLRTQEFLYQHGLNALTERLFISAKRHGAYPNLVYLKYSQYNSPLGDPVAAECRGLILDEENEWAVVSFPFAKFFNLGEPHAAEINWTTARVYEKLDGSLITLYPHAGKWQTASNGLPDASGPVFRREQTFAGLFWETWQSLGYRLPELQPRSLMFELMTPHNQVLVRHARPRLALLGVRNLLTLQEEDPEPFAEAHGWECVPTHPFGSLAAVQEHADGCDPLAREGYVVRDAHFRRVKVKCARYVALSHLRDEVTASPRNLLDVVRRNEGDEVLAYFPLLAPEYEEVREKYVALAARIDAVYASIREIPLQREFAAQALRYPFSWVLFALRKGQAENADGVLRQAPVENVERLLLAE